MYYFVIFFVVHIVAPVISGCAIAYFTYWISKRNE
ncbi:type I toxin-antitoxin system Fst family toxin [Mammaliicoccus sciuri]